MSSGKNQVRENQHWSGGLDSKMLQSKTLKINIINPLMCLNQEKFGSNGMTWAPKLGTVFFAFSGQANSNISPLDMTNHVWQTEQSQKRHLVPCLKEMLVLKGAVHHACFENKRSEINECAFHGRQFCTAGYSSEAGVGGGTRSSAGVRQAFLDSHPPTRRHTFGHQRQELN